jgi:transposase
MTPWPSPQSILLLDNCRIHHSEALIDLVLAENCLIIFFLLYYPHLNPIEESFSKMKSHLRRSGEQFRDNEDREEKLLDTCGCITPDDAHSWFRHLGFI